MPHVTIAGGGLSGMIAALRLRQRGCDVTLLEATDQLGGQASAQVHDGHATDHSYHIFPQWYSNAWALIDELGIRDNFTPSPNFCQLRAGQFPRFTILKNMTSPLDALGNIFSGAQPPSQMFLFFYSIVDLMSQPYRQRDALDQISVTGFLRSRWYRTEIAARQMQDLVLKGLSTPLYSLSAMTMQITMRHWVWYGRPSLHLTRSNLQESWITPIEKALRRAGCRIETLTRVSGLTMDGERVSRITVCTPAGPSEREVETLILALPPDTAAGLVSDPVYTAAPDLGKLHQLGTLPMAAFDIVLNRKIEGIPRGIVSLYGSSFSLSFVDISQTWGLPTTALSFVVGNIQELEGLSDEHVSALILAELRTYIPEIVKTDITYMRLQTHREQPLFMNYVGTWQFRPNATTQVGNLFLAGDYCRSWVDLVTQEAALTAGLLAAEAVRERLGLAPPVEIGQPSVPPRWLWFFAKLLLLPLAVLARLAVLITGDKERFA
jgi:uncharacterized protein with NAD-binding domain and iron-sulfur cluster